MLQSPLIKAGPSDNYARTLWCAPNEKDFVSTDPSLKALSSHYGLQRNVRLVSPEGKFLEHGCQLHRRASKSENVRHVINKSIIILKL